jgi:hypothetical protein
MVDEVHLKSEFAKDICGAAPLSLAWDFARFGDGSTSFVAAAAADWLWVRFDIFCGDLHATYG